ncbi:MAG: gamma-glutamyl-gamma-aminobutyrate hydrolase family protein [Clostridiaceae bacterium]|nr:gamma-glutamyl-gamma-aminobutyrate hydrolase family protein [Clostridiaceae bacterium]
MKPLILITPTYTYTDKLPLNDFTFRVNSTYVAAFSAAGAVPVVAVETDYEALVEHADGVLFAGGVDVDPVYFGEAAANDTVEICRARDELELALFEKAAAKGLPILGICRGIQLINVALGGSLWQDIPSQCAGSLVHSGGARHEVRCEDNSVVSRLFGESVLTNSYHHQSVKTPGRGLRVTAYASDGIVEAVEHESLPILGLQWHPERQTGDFKPDGVDDMTEVFRMFVRCCAERNSSYARDSSCAKRS